MSVLFAYEKINECKKRIKEIRGILKINPQFSKTTIMSYNQEIDNLKYEIKDWEKSIYSL